MLAIAALPGMALGRLGEPSTASPAAWAAAGAAIRKLHDAPLPPCTPVFTHGDLQITHVFVDGDEITGIIDWSEASRGDALFDIATLTLGHEEQLGDVVAGYGTGIDLEVIRAWWSLRSLLVARWLVEHGFDPSAPGCEFDVLRSRL